MANANADINIKKSVLHSPNMGSSVKRPFFNRTFGKLEKGSVRGSIFALCAAAIGSGVLNLPYVLALCGWVNGTFLILLGAVAAIWSLHLLIDAAMLCRAPNMSSLARAAGGRKLMYVLQITILIYIFGSVISYQIITTQLLQFFIT
mmetsp:Transcript_17228/g.16443  ORF Transcript_17228/g.16443 Transcript_17228/m.16443 type:complete len:147 (-) Transcript_17228:941-1381(-)